MIIKDILLWVIAITLTGVVVFSFDTSPQINKQVSDIVGNPKPIYYYDINIDEISEGYCSIETQHSIISSLKYFSDETGVQFIRGNSSLLSGVENIKYDCFDISEMKNNHGSLKAPFAIGIEEEGISIFSRNSKVTLNENYRGLILHETLHVIGLMFVSNVTTEEYSYHINNSKSIMNPVYSKIDVIDSNIIQFIKEKIKK